MKRKYLKRAAAVALACALIPAGSEATDAKIIILPKNLTQFSIFVILESFSYRLRIRALGGLPDFEVMI